MSEKVTSPTTEQRRRMLQEICDYHARLIDTGYCGKVGHSYDQGFLQDDVHHNETKKMRVKR